MVNIIKSKFLSLSYYRRKLNSCFDKLFPEQSTWRKAKRHYYNRTGKKLSYSQPKDINEKLMWLTRYWRHPLKTKCADKYRVREYVSDCGLSKLLVPLLGVYKNSIEIDFTKLPEQFVLKCNHGCGYNIIVHDKATIDEDAICNQLDSWLLTDYSKISQEIHYKNIPRRIICEKLLSETAPLEIQCWCINGDVDSLLVCRKNFDGSYEAWSYSPTWEHLCERKNEDFNSNIPKPQGLEELLDYAKILAKPFPFVRVDFYDVKGDLYLAELTFTPAANILSSYKDEFIIRLGDKLILPQKFLSNSHYKFNHLFRKPHTDQEYLAAFVELMNAKSNEIGLDPKTVWRNPSGKEDDGVSISTAKSLAIMTAFATGYPELCEIWNKRTHVVKLKGKSVLTISSSLFTNNILTSSFPILGGKTGSGYNLEGTKEYNTLVCVTQINEKMVAGAIMDATSQADRFEAMKQLFQATKAVMNGNKPSIVTAATKACSVLIPQCPRTYLADKFSVIYAQNENDVTGTMSIAKVMALMVILDHIKDIDRLVEIKSIDLYSGSGAFLSEGDITSIKDLMYSMMLPSSNQAAQALGRITGEMILKYAHCQK